VNLPVLLSGRQERNRRGGTENLPGIAGFAAAAERMAGRLPADLAHMAAMRQRLEVGLHGLLGDDLVIYGEGAERLPNTTCLRLGPLESERVLGKLERAGVIASSGAACTASGTQPSHVLLAMGASPAEAKGSVRFSLGADTSAAEIDEALAVVRRVVLPLLAEAAAQPS
jgi:cysteine desulfurase